MEVEITRLNHTGQGIGTIDGKVTFVNKTIPGDIVELEEIIDYGNYQEGTIKNYFKRSPAIEPIPCPYYQECGGCQLMGLSYQKQLEYKKKLVQDLMKKYANLTVDPTIVPSPQTLHYRNKITLQVKNGQIGLFKSDSKTLIPIEECLLVKDKTNHLISLIQENVNLEQVEQIVIKEFQQKTMVHLIGNPNRDEAQQALENQVDSLYINNHRIIGSPKLTEQLGPYHYGISPNSFFQVNKEQTVALYDTIKKYLGTNNNHILDLYCGMSSIGIYVSTCAKKITGIELNPSSINDAKENITTNHLMNIQVQKGDVGTLLDTKNTYDAIIIDPPRSGLDKKTIRGILQIKSPKVIYISCNPITLARDLNRLKEIYDLQKITAFDLFPNTYHVETICVLERKGLKK